MSLNFVASSVLQVSDGVNEEKETIINNEEVNNVRRNARPSGEYFTSALWVIVDALYAT